VVPGAGGCDANSDLIASPDRCDRLNNFQQETRAVLDGTTVGVGPLVTAILKKLVQQIAIAGVQLNPVEIRRLGTRSCFAVVLDDSRNFGDIEWPMWRRLDPAAGSGDQVMRTL
jgi:hypothetical protein